MMCDLHYSVSDHSINHHEMSVQLLLRQFSLSQVLCKRWADSLPFSLHGVRFVSNLSERWLILIEAYL